MAAQVYWVGADGNAYVTSDQGVKNMGKFIQGNASGFDSQGASMMATRINDPNPPADQTPAYNGGPSYTDKSNDIQIQNKALEAADAQRTAGEAGVDKTLTDLTGAYDTEAKANEGTYGTQSDTNRSNLQTNKESALVNAAQGRRGLFGTLQSLGALSGSGIDLANRAVQQGANEDLTGASGNFNANQTGLDAAIAKFRQEDAQRRKDAASGATNAKAKVRFNSAKAKQDAYTALANDYTAEGDTTNAQNYARLAASLYPDMAGNSVPDTSNFGYSAAAFTPGSLQSYIAGSGDTTVSTRPATGTGAGRSNLPGLVASDNRRRSSLVAA